MRFLSVTTQVMQGRVVVAVEAPYNMRGTYISGVSVALIEHVEHEYYQ